MKIELSELRKVKGIGEKTLEEVRKYLMKSGDIENKSVKSVGFPNKKYDIIYADPPWSYQYNGSKHHGDAKQHYNTMSVEDICQLPIRKIMKENCTLFMWVTSPQLPIGLEVMKRWGFKFKTVAFVWVKLRRKYAKKDIKIPKKLELSDFKTLTGWYTNPNVELLLVGTKGNMLEKKSTTVKQLIFSPLEKHSKKPNEARNRIIDLYGDVDKIELFAREKVEGWDNWGNEI